MTYANVMVNLKLDGANAHLLQKARQIATRFGTSVTGIAVAQPMMFVAGDGYVCGDLSDQDREQTEKDLAATEAEFKSALHGHLASLQWISEVVFTPLADYVARAARGADLILTQAASGSFIEPTRTVSTADLVLRAGRPVLIVPDAPNLPEFERILVAWKDTREARRAIADALPMLRVAKFVTVVEIASEAEHDAVALRLDDVVQWLGRHGVKAHKLFARSVLDDATQLKELVKHQRADLIVAGAYGHSRTREWVLGGVTGDLLLHAGCCALVSH